jgi:hypothetical protein
MKIKRGGGMDKKEERSCKKGGEAVFRIRVRMDSQKICLKNADPPLPP